MSAFGKRCRPLRARFTQWRLAAFGNWNFTDCFPAMNLTRGQSLRCPLLPLATWESGRSTSEFTGLRGLSRRSGGMRG